MALIGKLEMAFGGFAIVRLGTWIGMATFCFPLLWQEEGYGHPPASE